jgi:hypothetical protein
LTVANAVIRFFETSTAPREVENRCHHATHRRRVDRAAGRVEHDRVDVTGLGLEVTLE